MRPAAFSFVQHRQWVALTTDLHHGLYCLTSPEGAIGERFAQLRAWRPKTFRSPRGPYAPAIMEAGHLQLTDLGDVTTLCAQRVARVIEIVTRDRAVTQPLAARIFEQCASDGLEWWSAYLADWTNVLLWTSAAARRPMRQEAQLFSCASFAAAQIRLSDRRTPSLKDPFA